jgi:hypothetical protein
LLLFWFIFSILYWASDIVDKEKMNNNIFLLLNIKFNASV